MRSKFDFACKMTHFTDDCSELKDVAMTKNENPIEVMIKGYGQAMSEKFSLFSEKNFYQSLVGASSWSHWKSSFFWKSLRSDGLGQHYSFDHQKLNSKDFWRSVYVPLDGFQMEAFSSYLEGRSVLVDGPPGTGKSQLIKNIALHGLFQGRKILVLTKNTDVFQGVLDYSGRVKKESFAESNGVRLLFSDESGTGESEKEVNAFLENVKVLSKVSELMNTSLSDGTSINALLNHLTDPQLNEASPSIRPDKIKSSFGFRDLEHLLNGVELAYHDRALFSEMIDDPFAKLSLDRIDEYSAQDMFEAAELFLSTNVEIENTLKSLPVEFNEDHLSSDDFLAAFNLLEERPVAWSRYMRWKKSVSSGHDVLLRFYDFCFEFERLRKQALRTLDFEVMTSEEIKNLKALLTAYDKKPSLWNSWRVSRFKSRLEEVAFVDLPENIVDVLSWFEIHDRIEVLKRKRNEYNSLIFELERCSLSFSDFLSCWDWQHGIDDLRLFGGVKDPKKYDVMYRSIFERLSSDIEVRARAHKDVLTFWKFKKSFEWKNVHKLSLYLEGALPRIGYLQNWLHLNSVLASLKECGALNLANAMEDKILNSAQEARVHFLNSFLRSKWLSAVKEHPELLAFKGHSMRGAVAETVESWSHLLLSNAKSVSHGSGLVDFISLDLAKKHWKTMRSDYDCVVIDNSNELRFEDCFPFLCSGKRFVVLGDIRQMPPRSVREENRFLSDSYVFEKENAFSFLLSQNVPVFNLRWAHGFYHPSLMRPANKLYYHNQLFLIPSAVNTFGSEIELFDLSGASDDNCLKSGCDGRILEIFQSVFKKHEAGHSICFVLSKDEDAKDFSAVLDDFLGGFDVSGEMLVKSLSEMQGVHCDTVCFLLPNVKEIMVRPDGHRIFNLMLSRARRKTFMAFPFDEVSQLKSSSRGQVDLLRFFNELQHFSPEVDDKASSLFEESVANFIKGCGFDVDFQLGEPGCHVDIVVKDHEGRYCLAISCFGGAAQESKNMYDRILTKPLALEDRGWRTLQIWLPDWIRRNAEEKSFLLSVLDEFKAQE